MGIVRSAIAAACAAAGGGALGLRFRPCQLLPRRPRHDALERLIESFSATRSPPPGPPSPRIPLWRSLSATTNFVAFAEELF